MSALMSDGAILVSPAQAFASRKVTPLLATTLSANIVAEDSTVQMAADVGIGAMITVNPGGLTEEIFKVSNVTGASPPFTATITPTAEFPHTSGDSVTYEPGVSSRLLVDDTPATVDPQIILEVWHGADGQTYRVSAVATCDNGELVELEGDLVVTELTPTSTKVKQPDETRDLAFDLSELLEGNVLQSGIPFVSRVATVSTTLAALAAIGDATVTLAAHPGIGALLTLNPSGQPREKLKVSGVSGGGPYLCTVHPTVEFGHSNGENVNYEPGATTRFLVSTTPTISGGQEAIVRLRRGAAGQVYRVTMLGLGTSNLIVQDSCFVSTPEL
jgi:hypothetical protein